MTIRETTAHFLVCDTCPEDVEAEWRGPCTCDSPETEHETWGWLKLGDRLMCDRCQEWSLEDVCAAESDHDWLDCTSESRADGWMPAREGRGRWRMRWCRSCHKSERQNEGEEWRDYRQENSVWRGKVE